ncbi:tRNA (guanine(10)-N(2))-dimethyltransferase [archaeon SCG-AAA382B04]|nr:tRNA (guanine(10)-N(2))-dimethyltransferase [archaeon SCG-AAA382B04]
MRTKEGETELKVPEIEEDKFPPSSSGVFFNPRMESNRDLTIACVKANSPQKFFDAHSATGAKAIRVANEVSNDISVFACDWSKDAIEFIEKNREINQVGNVKIINQDNRIPLHKNKFDFIDLDPFGSPVPFLDASIESLIGEGILAITATDTAPLCGSHIKAGLRRYGARTLRTPYHKEVGLRTLLGKVIRKGAEKDKALIPQLSYYQNHYFRAYMKNKKGAEASDKLIEQIGVIQHCFGCGNRVIVKGYLPNLDEKCRCGKKYKNAGPLFLGELGDKGFIKQLIEQLEKDEIKTKEENQELLQTRLQEVDFPPTFYDIHKACKRLSTSAPKTKSLLKKLREKGFRATKTHFEPTGIKTDTSINELNKVIRSFN